MPSKLNIIKKDTAAILELSTVHAIPNIIRSEKKILKIVWAVSLVISIAACSFYIGKSFAEYLSYDFASKIEVISEEESEFPTISACSRTLFNLRGNFFLNASFNLEKIDFQNSVPFYDPVLYQCYRLNYGENFNGNDASIWKSKLAGRTYGLNLEIYNPSEHPYTAIYLNIHNKSNPPLNIENSIIITSGSDYYFSINRLFNQKLEEPYNDCLKNAETFKGNKRIIDFISKSKRTYNQIECFELCLDIFLKETSKCNCSGQFGQVVSRCFENKKSECFFNFLNTFDNKNFLNYCPLECDSNVLTVTQYSSNLPRSGNTTYSSKLKTFEEVSKGYFGIHIFYERLEYKLITQIESETKYGLFSNIGGILGLFLGISFLSIIEIIDILIQIIFILLPN